jgi:hypothetical protein
VAGTEWCSSCEFGKFSSSSGGTACIAYYSSSTGASSTINLNDITQAAATLTLSTDFATIVRATFDNQFKLDVSTAAGINANRITITSVTAGSTVVAFTILPVAGSSVNPAQAVAAIQLQINDPNSALRQATTTSAAISVTVSYACTSGPSSTPCGGSNSSAGLKVSFSTLCLTIFSILYLFL